MGSGYRTFTAGEVLTASNVQDYLMDQSVMVFADSTARETGIGTANFEEGMVSYLEDSDTVEVYDGSAWASVAPASTSGLDLINTTSFSAVSSQSINDVFSATYKNYRIILNFATAVAIDKVISMRLRKAGVDFSGASGYENISLGVTAGGATSNATGSATSFTLLNNAHYTSQRSVVLDILNAQGGTTISGQSVGGTSSVTNALNINGICLTSNTYDGFTIITSASNFTTASTVSVYGYNG
jgi:hypothetical protein